MKIEELLEASSKVLEFQGNAVPLSCVLIERAKQEKKWGQQDHVPVWYLAILMEEVGELSQAILETHFDHGENRGISNIRKETVQVAAVALAMLECLDRNMP